MTMQIEHEFEELGIPLEAWAFGSFNGKCTISVDEAGDWCIDEIDVELRKLINGMWRKHMHRLDKGNKKELQWFWVLSDAIEHFDKREIEEAIAEAMPLTYEPQSMFKDAGRVA